METKDLIRLSHGAMEMGDGFASGPHVLGPQGLIDRALQIESCDALVGVFWKRLGTRFLPINQKREALAPFPSSHI
jgi:hypothetical protein